MRSIRLRRSVNRAGQGRSWLGPGAGGRARGASRKPVGPRVRSRSPKQALHEIHRRGEPVEYQSAGPLGLLARTGKSRCRWADLMANDLARRAERVLAGELDLAAQTSKVRVFRSRDGREIAVERSRRLATTCGSGSTMASFRGSCRRTNALRAYRTKPPSRGPAALKHNAPTLSVGHRAWHLRIADVDALREFVKRFKAGPAGTAVRVATAYGGVG